MLWKVERWGAEAVFGRGAIPIKDMQRMELAGTVWNTIKRVQSLSGDDIHKLTDGEREILAWLREDGYFD